MNKLWVFPSIKFVFLKGLSLNSSFQRICHPGGRAGGASRWVRSVVAYAWICGRLHFFQNEKSHRYGGLLVFRFL
jgi:hypothetical protein